MDCHPRVKVLIELLLTIRPDPELLAAAERGEDILTVYRSRSTRRPPRMSAEVELHPRSRRRLEEVPCDDSR